VESQLHVHRDGETLWKERYSNLEVQDSATRQELAAVVTARDALLLEKTSLLSQADTAQKAFKQLHEKLAHAASELTTNTRQLQAVQAELRNANRRADEAVQTQKDLQTEGTNLMRSLDEMRPKIVELTGAKLELGDKIEGLEHTLRNRDSTIAQLESTIDELQYHKEQVETEKANIIEKHQKERISALSNSSELQKAFAEAQTDLEAARASILALEAERADHHQLVSRQTDEIDRLAALSRTQAIELSSIERDLEEREGAGEEQGGFLERAQNEIEFLRAEISSKDEEIERLREAVSSRPSPAALPRTLDEEMVGSLRQQQALELSAAHSTIRALETSVFEAEAKSHSLQKRVKALEDEATQSRLSRAVPQRYSPTSRTPSGNNASVPRSTLKPAVHTIPARSVIDQELAPETLHKRRVSLSMLKARIDSEIAAASAGTHLSSRPISPMLPKHEGSVLSTVPEPQDEAAWETPNHLLNRPRFLDESHVFWCHCCSGDLVIL
jgi:chromosome segregation ATPase